jgi:hypothetical protein
VHPHDTPASDTALVPLRRRDGEIIAYVTIDAADATWANQYRWSMSAKGYARRRDPAGGRTTYPLLHREILGLIVGDPREGDHINRDKLDCRRGNLRILPKGGGAQNRSSFKRSSSRYRGVTWHRLSGKWAAQVKTAGRNVHLGLYADEEAAAAVAQEARSRLLPFSTD